jgi:hypothetical protein
MAGLRDARGVHHDIQRERERGRVGEREKKG